MSKPCHYHFITHWHFPYAPETIYKLLEDAASFPKWWPSVYLDIKILEEGDEDGSGKLVAAYSKGWLPHALKWQFRVTKTEFPNGFSLESLGDFKGKGNWTFTPTYSGCDAQYDWEVEVEKPLSKRLSFLLRPLLEWNHRWPLKRGFESATIELAKRTAHTEEFRRIQPAPPPPTFLHSLFRNKVFFKTKEAYSR